MSISYRDFQASALALLCQEDEIDYRNAASRSYYAAYHACLEISHSLPVYVDIKGGMHERLIQQLEGAKDKNLKSIGYILRNSKKIRCTADYCLSIVFSREDATAFVAQIKKLLERVNAVKAQKL